MFVEIHISEENLQSKRIPDHAKIDIIPYSAVCADCSGATLNTNAAKKTSCEFIADNVAPDWLVWSYACRIWHEAHFRMTLPYTMIFIQFFCCADTRTHVIT